MALEFARIRNHLGEGTYWQQKTPLQMLHTIQAALDEDNQQLSDALCRKLQRQHRLENRHRHQQQATAAEENVMQENKPQEDQPIKDLQESQEMNSQEQQQQQEQPMQEIKQAGAPYKRQYRMYLPVTDLCVSDTHLTVPVCVYHSRREWSVRR
jgi:hypothetical protein